MSSHRKGKSLSEELTQAVLDCTDWLSDFQYWDKAIELKSFTALIAWLNENVDPVLAAEVLKDESNFRIVLDEVLSRVKDSHDALSAEEEDGYDEEEHDYHRASRASAKAAAGKKKASRSHK